MGEWTPIVIGLLAFGAIGGFAFVAGQHYVRAAHLNRRLPIRPEASPQSTAAGGGGIAALVGRHFDEKRFGLDTAARTKLRLSLLQAGYFRRDAVNFYFLWRVVAVALLPVAAYLLFAVTSPDAPTGPKLIAIALAAALGFIAPDAFLARRRRRLAAEYRTVFPDVLDLLLVCVDAGLGLEAALDRVTGETGKRSRNFGINLAVMGAEMRAGRSFVDALGSMADRLIIPEARSLVALLRQSRELGSDISEALRVFSDEMRDKRLLRAEEQANKLPVKMSIPLALFIFPVVLLVIMLPMVIRLLALFRRG
jgi:tight adherence protein C